MVIDPRIDHVTAVVADAEAASDAMARLLGAPPTTALTLPSMNIRSFQLGATELHLNAPRGAGPVADHLANHGPSVHHLALRVAHLESALAALAARGIAPRGGIIATAPGLREVFVDPDATAGIWIQLVERRTGSTRADQFDASAVTALAAITAKSKPSF